MEGKFITLIVCAALMHISLVEVSPATAAIQKEAIDDICLLRLYQGVAIMQAKQAIQYIFSQDLRDYLVKGGLSGEDSNEGNSNVLKTCTDTLLARRMGALDANLAAALIVDPKTSSAVMSARTSGVNGLMDLSKDVCLALILAVGKNSSTAAAEIQALADKHISLAAASNKAYFDVMQASRHFQPGMKNMIRDVERRSTSALVSGFNETFLGLKEIASSGGLEAQNGEISSLFETFGKRAISQFVVYLEEKFDIAETLFTSQIIQPTSQGETASISFGNQNFTAAAMLEAREGASEVFNTIRRFENLRLSRSNSYESARNKTFAAFMTVIHATLNAISKMDSKCSSAVEAKWTIEVTIKKLVDHLYEDVTSRDANNFQATEDRLNQDASKILKDLFSEIQHCIQKQKNYATEASTPAPVRSPLTNRPFGLLNLGLPRVQLQTSPSLLGLNLNLKIDANILGLLNINQEKSLTDAKKTFQSVLTGFKTRFAQRTSGIPAKGKAIVPLADIRTETITNAKNVMDTIFDPIITVVRGSGKSDTDIAEALSAIDVCRQQSRLGMDEGYGTLFGYIAAYNQNVPEDNPSDVIEAARIATSTAYLTALDNIFRGFGPSITKTTSAAKKEASSLLRKAVDGLYRAIQGAQSNNSCEILQNLAGMEKTVTRNFVLVNFEIYDEIRRSANYDAQNEAALTRTQYKSIAHTTKASAGIFRAIRIFVAANCHGSSTNSNDTLSSINAEQHDVSSEVVNLLSSYAVALASISGESKDDIAAATTETASRIAVTRTITY